MVDFADKVVGVSSAVSGVLSFVFYRLYRSRTETARQVRNIPVWQADLDLMDQLSSAHNQSLDYAAVEGVVKAMGRTLHSQHGNEEGVIKRSQLIEHKSKRVNGFWNDVKKELRDTTEMVPFAIVKQDKGDPKFRIEVTDPSMASHLQGELDTTYDRFEPNSSSLVQIGLDRLFGEMTKGIQETEKMLLTGSSVLGVGKVYLSRGEIKLGPPDDTGRSYIITKMRLTELVRYFESQSYTFKILAVISACIGGTLFVYLVWKNVKEWLSKRQQRLQFEELRRELARQNHVPNDAGENEQEDLNTCVVCLVNPRQVISLNCGHITMCADCAEALPLPKTCPVCRADIVRFIPVYRP